MDLRRTGFSFNGFERQLWICEAATRLVSEGICLAGRDQPDSCRDMGAHHQLLINGALDAKIECARGVRIDSTVTDSPIHARGTVVY